jgi:competence protein ComEC
LVVSATEFDFAVARRWPASLRVIGAPFLAAASENEDRLFLWLPVALAAGIGLYFGLPREPGMATAISLLLLGSICAYRLLRLGPSSSLLLLGMILLGFAAAKIQVALFTGPSIAAATDVVRISGFVENIVRGPGRKLKVTLRLESASGIDRAQLPRKVRITSPAQKELRVSHFVEGEARLFPLMSPIMPGGYDFGRAQWLQGIGGSGEAASAWTIRQDRRPGLWLAAKRHVEDLRRTMARRIRLAIPGERGLLAVALITGERTSLPQDMQTSLQASGLAHIVSISGLHMSLVAGGFFWMLRALLALSPGLALRTSIKKWSAGAALAAGLAYLAISGCEVPTQRSYIMVAVMFAAIIADRPALSLRNVALAALVVLLLDPAAVLQPGLQMSFLAVTGLISFFESRRGRETSPLRGLAGHGWFAVTARRFIRASFALAATTVIAGICTGPAAAYHFNRVAPYGLIGNLLAVPVISALVMPGALIGTLLMPLGLEQPAFAAMERGLTSVMVISDWTAALPGAQWVVPRHGAESALLMAGGILWVSLLTGPIRWLGLAVFALGMVLTMLVQHPDVIIERMGRNVALRNDAGELVLANARRSRFATERWLLADGDGTPPSRAAGRQGFRCNANICIGVAKSKRIAYADKKAEGKLTCPEADVLIAAFPLRGACTTIALRIDRFDVWRNGSHALFIEDGGIRVETARQLRGDRPWVAKPQKRHRSSHQALTQAVSSGE